MDIREIVTEYFGQYKASTNNNVFIKCPSPDHNDSNPSCHLDLEKKVFICFSCGAKGTLETALRWKKAPPDLVSLFSEYKPAYKHPTRVEEHLLDEMILYAWDFEPQSWIDEGFDPRVLHAHDIGFDIYNQRITIPIYNKEGRLIAVSARALGSEQPRYKIYKTELMDYCPVGYNPKIHNYLWRYNRVPPDAQYLVIVEGFKAALKLVQNGEHNVVALMGKMLSAEQEAEIVSSRQRVYLMLDNDEAGRKGQLEIAIRLSKRGTDTWIVDYHTRQPDTLTQNELQEALSKSLPLFQWRRKGEP